MEEPTGTTSLGKGESMLGLKRLDHVGVVVDDLVDARRRLEEEFGLKAIRELVGSEVGAVFMDCGNASIELFQMADSQANMLRIGEGATARIDHLAIEVEDLATTMKALEALGIRLTGPPETRGAFTSVWTEAESSDGVKYQFMQIEKS